MHSTKAMKKSLESHMDFRGTTFASYDTADRCLPVALLLELKIGLLTTNTIKII